MNKEKPIIFSTPMVQAIQEGRKTMTRRVVKGPRCTDDNGFVLIRGFWVNPKKDTDHCFDGISPYCVGDRLWVRETWQSLHNMIEEGAASVFSDRYFYRADYKPEDIQPSELWNIINWNWRPSIFMPRKAARIFLEVKSVRMERIQDIRPDDVKAEGWPEFYTSRGVEIKYVGPYCESSCYSTRENKVCSPDFCYSQACFSAFWNKLNAKRGFGWEDNPWVWIIQFERIKP
jgi:hypothetical protein